MSERVALHRFAICVTSDGDEHPWRFHPLKVVQLFTLQLFYITQVPVDSTFNLKKSYFIACYIRIVIY